MITTYLFDFSRVLLFPIDQIYSGELNEKYKLIKDSPGFQFQENFQLNEPLLDYLESVKDSKDLYIFTSGFIQNDSSLKPRLSSVFKDIFSAGELGVSKKDPNAYEVVAEKINKLPSEILFIDDTLSNIEAAKQAGLNAVVYTSFEELKKELLQYK